MAYLFSIPLIAQNSLTGLVTDSTGAGFPFVNIALLNAADSSQVKGTISDEQGNYDFVKIKSGTYLLKFFSVGHTVQYSQPLGIDSSSVISVPPLVLRSSGISLNEVSITAIKKVIEFKNGMTVMNVENNMMATGNTVLDLLRRIPGVTVDNNNIISISGKQGVRIMLDGRMQQLSANQMADVLSAMSADLLSRIEIIKNPPAKYDAGGSAGIINIVSKKVKARGFSGSVNYNPGYGQRFGNSLNVALNFKTSRLTTFIQANSMYKEFINWYDYNKTVGYLGNTTSLDQNGSVENLRRFLNGKLGMDYELSKKTNIGFVVYHSIDAASPLEKATTSIGGYNDLGFDHMTHVSDEKNNWTNPNYNVNAEHKFDTLGTVLSLAVDYSRFDMKASKLNSSLFLNEYNDEVLYPAIINSKSVSDMSVFTQKLDFTKHLKAGWLLETGAKATFVRNNNDFVLEREDPLAGNFIRDTGFSNIYHYRETVLATYVNFTKQLKHGSFQLGMRAENTHITGNNVTNGFSMNKSYLNFFPSLAFDYGKTEKHNFQFNYNRRIDRPDYSQLNPFKRYEDRYVSSMGNPNLNPQYSDNVSLSHVYKSWLTNSIGYSYFSQPLTYATQQNDSLKETIQTNVNLTNGSYTFYNLFIQKQLTKWWSLSFSATVMNMYFNGMLDDKKLTNSTISYYVYMNHDIILPSDFKLQLSGYYNAPSLYATMYTKQRWSSDIAVKRTFYKKKLTLTLSLVDMFYTDRERTRTVFENQNASYSTRSDSRRFRLTLNYKFGKMNIRVNEKHSNEQENGRLKKD